MEREFRGYQRSRLSLSLRWAKKKKTATKVMNLAAIPFACRSSTGRSDPGVGRTPSSKLCREDSTIFLLSLLKKKGEIISLGRVTLRGPKGKCQQSLWEA